jgi:hypothetical protein
MVFGQVRFREDVTTLLMARPLTAEAHAEIESDLGDTPTSITRRTALLGKAIRDHISRLDWGASGQDYDDIMSTSAAEWSRPENAEKSAKFFAGRIPFAVLHPVFAKLGGVRCAWIGRFVDANRDKDLRSFTYANLPVRLAKLLTAEELGMLAGYPSVAMFANARDFCRRNKVLLITDDMYSPDHAVTYADKDQLPLPARSTAPVVVPTVPPFAEILANTNV